MPTILNLLPPRFTVQIARGTEHTFEVTVLERDVRTNLPIVELELEAVVGDSSDDTLTLASHGLSNGDQVMLRDLVGGYGLVEDRLYNVVGVAGNDWQLALTYGGDAVSFTSDITSCTVVKLVPVDITGGTAQLVAELDRVGGDELLELDGTISTAAAGKVRFTIDVDDSQLGSATVVSKWAAAVHWKPASGPEEVILAGVIEVHPFPWREIP